MMPAQLVTCAVTMSANTLPQLFHFLDELIARHTLEIRIHGASE
jgi:hypothetical protein